MLRWSFSCSALWAVQSPALTTLRPHATLPSQLRLFGNVRLRIATPGRKPHDRKTKAAGRIGSRAAKSELVNLRGQHPSRPSATQNQQADFAPHAAPHVGSSQPTSSSYNGADKGQNTLAFWNKLNSIIDTEASMRAVPSGGLSESNTRGFIKSRITAGTMAVEALSALETANVDALALSVRDALSTWYGDGVRISKMADQLMNSGDALRQGKAGITWKLQEMKHNASVGKVNQLGADVRAKLQTQYRIAFPALK